jgi:glycosyltransferase involved in cell wall biosynthesis
LGNLSSGRGITALLEAFADNGKIDRALVIVGYGELATLVQEYAARWPSIYYLDAVPPEQVLEYASAADLGLCLIEDSCLSYRLSLPNKLFEYIMAGIPVIVSDLPEMASVVGANQIGEVVAQLDSPAILTAIDRVLATDPSVLKDKLSLAAQRLCWETQEQQMIDSYREHVL